MKRGTLIINNEKINILYETLPTLECYFKSEINDKDKISIKMMGKYLNTHNEIKLTLVTKWNYFYFYVKNDLELYSYEKERNVDWIVLKNVEIIFDEFLLNIGILSGILEKIRNDKEGYNRYCLKITEGHVR